MPLTNNGTHCTRACGWCVFVGVCVHTVFCESPVSLSIAAVYVCVCVCVCVHVHACVHV